MNRLIKKSNNDLYNKTIEYIKNNWNTSRWWKDNYYYILDSTYYDIDYSDFSDVLTSTHEYSDFLILNYNNSTDEVTIQQCSWDDTDNTANYSDNTGIKKHCDKLIDIINSLSDESDTPISIINKIIDKYKDTCKLNIDF